MGESKLNLSAKGRKQRRKEWKRRSALSAGWGRRMVWNENRGKPYHKVIIESRATRRNKARADKALVGWRDKRNIIVARDGMFYVPYPYRASLDVHQHRALVEGIAT